MGHNTFCTTAENEPEKNPAAAAFFSSADIRPAAFFSGGFRRHHSVRRWRSNSAARRSTRNRIELRIL